MQLENDPTQWQQNGNGEYVPRMDRYKRRKNIRFAHIAQCPSPCCMDFVSEDFAVGVNAGAAASSSKIHNILCEMRQCGRDEWMIGFGKMETCLQIVYGCVYSCTRYSAMLACFHIHSQKLPPFFDVKEMHGKPDGSHFTNDAIVRTTFSRRCTAKLNIEQFKKNSSTNYFINYIMWNTGIHAARIAFRLHTTTLTSTVHDILWTSNWRHFSSWIVSRNA